jgi:hypothetical protein
MRGRIVLGLALYWLGMFWRANFKTSRGPEVDDGRRRLWSRARSGLFYRVFVMVPTWRPKLYSEIERFRLRSRLWSGFGYWALVVMSARWAHV